MGVNIVYTLASIPLALHYLSNQQFGLWQVAITVAGYLLLIDMGMTGASARILIDHKDDPTGDAYRSVIKISWIVFSIQGLAIAVIGGALSFWMPQLANVASQFPDPATGAGAARAVVILTAGQCLILGLFFPTRVFWNLAIAHQRYDIYNYVQVTVLIVQFGALWIAFHEGLGIYSVLVASAISSVFGFFIAGFVAWRAHFLPPAPWKGRFDRSLFKEIFFYGTDQFLMALGSQLNNASQVVIISHTLGLTAAAIWSVATKPFLLAQQLVGRIFAFSTPALAEMIVRNERDRLLQRFRDIVAISVALAVLIGGSIALCNESFLQVWTKGRIAWDQRNDLLLALWFIIVVAPGLHVFGTTLTKQIGRMRYVYFVEGILFVTLAVLSARHFGIGGIIVSAIVADILCSGVFGVRRTVVYFGLSSREVIIGWMAAPLKQLLLFAPVLVGCKFMTQALPSLDRFVINASVAGTVGLWLFWRVGLTTEFRREARGMLGKVRSRLVKGAANP